MKINIEVPDWSVEEGEDMYIHAGTELVAKRYFKTKTWYVKTSRCNFCGDCCRNLGQGFKNQGMVDENGTCIHLKDCKCLLGMWKPYACIMDFHDDPTLKPSKCTEEFKEV